MVMAGMEGEPQNGARSGANPLITVQPDALVRLACRGLRDDDAQRRRLTCFALSRHYLFHWLRAVESGLPATTWVEETPPPPKKTVSTTMQGQEQTSVAKSKKPLNM